MKRPLLPVALFYVGGLLLAETARPPLAVLFSLAFVILLLAILWSRARAWLIWPLLVVVGWTNLVSRTAVISPHDLRSVIGSEPALVTVRGRLMETPSLRVYDHGETEAMHTLARVSVTAIAREENWQPAVGQIMVSTAGELTGEYFHGREVEITGVLAPPPKPVAPGLFDYQTYLARQGIYYQLKAHSLGDWQTVDAEANGPRFTDRFLSWAQRTLARGLPAHDEPLRLMWAMTLGWKTALTGEVNEPFMRSGTMHIFAISGLHIALIAGILVSLLRVLRVPRIWCGAVVIPLIWFYTAATGWQPSAIRSTVMMTIIIGGWSLRRPSDLLNSLAAAAFVILIWDPQQLFQASFQLSFFVVLSIALFMPPLKKLRDRLLATDPLLAPEVMTKRQRAFRWVARVVATGFVTSLAAWLGSLPLTAYYFHLFCPVTLLANLIIVPMSSLALMCNLGSLICGDWFPWATELFNHSGWFWMLGMVKISRWATEIPGAYFYVPSPSPLTFWIYYGVLIGTMSGWLWARERRWRTVAALFLVAAFYGWRWYDARNEVELTVLALNGGHAEYVDAAGRRRDWLIDCGNTNAVEFVTKLFLRAKGVNRLPRLMLTHGDLLHVGGAGTLDAEFGIGEIFASPTRFRSVAYRHTIADFEKEPSRLRTIGRGDQFGPWKILHPSEADRFAQADDAALVLMGEFGGVRVLLLSDLGRPGQQVLIERTPELRADVVVTGLPRQSEAVCDALLDIVQPRVIIVADTEFPATERAPASLRERLALRGVPVFYTRETGALTLKFRRHGFEIETVNGEVVFPLRR